MCMNPEYTEYLVGVGAFADDQTPYGKNTALLSSYSGPVSLTEFQFPAVPGLKGIIGDAVLLTAEFASKLLRVEVWQDTAPFFDEYLVRIWTAGAEQEGTGTATAGEILSAGAAGGLEGEVGVGLLPALLAIPFLVMLKVVVVIGVAAILGALVWRVSRSGISAGLGTPFLLVAGALGIAYLLSNRRGK